MADSIIRIILQAVDKASGTFKNVSQSAQGLQKNVAGASEELNVNWLAIAKTGAILLATAATVKKAYDFAEEGAKVTRLKTSYENLAYAAGESSTKIVNSIQKASLYTVSEYDAMQSASNALMLGLGADSEKLGNLMEIAAFRGRAMGLSTTQAFSDIVRGVGRMSPMILDNLGIVIDAENTYKVYADSLGKTSAELTTAEKKQALLNKVLEEGNKMLREAGGLALDTAGAYEKLGATWSNFWKGFGAGFADFGVRFITTGKEYADIEKDIAESTQKSGGSYKEYSDAIYRYAAGLSRAYSEMGKGVAVIDEAGNIHHKWTEYFKDGKIWQSYDVIIKQNALLSKSQYAESQRLTAQAQAYQKLKAGLADMADETKGYNEELALQAGLSNQISDIQDKFLATIERYGKSSAKTADAQRDMAESTAKFVYQLVTENDNIDISTSQNYNLAHSLGLIDDKSYALAGAMDYLNKQFDLNGNQMIDQSEITDLYNQAVTTLTTNAEQLMQDRSATWSINILINGVRVPANYLSASTIAQTVAANSALVPSVGNTKTPATRRASGGPVQMGQPYIVGENGMEVVVPNSSGTVVPNNKLASSNTVKIYGNPTFVLGRDGISASDILEQVSVA